MPVSTKYQLSDAFQSRDGEVVIPGTEIATGRAVVVHLLVAGDSSYNRQLMESVGTIPVEHRQKVLETGVQDGVPFVVTAELPGNPSFKKWLTAIQNERPEEKPKSVFHTGVAIPALEQTAVPVSEATKEPGEFTKFFGSKPASEVSAPVTPAVPVVAQAVEPMEDTRSPHAAPSEFTQFLGRAPSEATQPVIVPPPVAATSEIHEAPSELTTPAVGWAKTSTQSFEPGEFTRFLGQEPAEPKTSSSVVAWGTPVVPAEPAKPAPPVVPASVIRPSPSGPGEFTRFVSAQAETPAAPPPPQKPDLEVGSPSNRVVNKALVPPKPVSPLIPTAPIQPPPVPPPAPPGSGPGEFTRFFQAQSQAQSPSSMPASQPGQPMFADDPLFGPAKPSSPSGPGEFTKAMQSPLVAEPFRGTPHAPPPQKQPPGEFTRMMQGGSPLQHQPAPPPAPPPDPRALPWRPTPSAGEYTKIFESTPGREDHYSPAAPMPIHSGTPDLFSSPAPRPVPAPSGPSDYTQMMNSPKPAPAPAAVPKAPPAASKPAAGVSTKPLIIIAGVLVLLAIILLIVFLVLK